MTHSQYEHQYRVGDAVLAHVNGVPIPGVVEDRREGSVLVRLSEPWVNESGRKSNEAWLTTDQLDPSIDEETGGTEALM